jgi:nucleoside-diphosphate-sugar epimerase
MKKALVCGAGGFIASHLVKRLKKDAQWVRGVDLKYPEFSPTAADEFLILDLREETQARAARKELTACPPNARVRFFEYRISREGLAVMVC